MRRYAQNSLKAARFELPSGIIEPHRGDGDATLCHLFRNDVVGTDIRKADTIEL